MGQKVNPYGFRLGITTDWKSRWFATRKEYSENLFQDWKVRDYLMNELPHAAISRVLFTWGPHPFSLLLPPRRLRPRRPHTSGPYPIRFAIYATFTAACNPRPSIPEDPIMLRALTTVRRG